VLGGALIGLAAVLDAGSKRIGLWITLGVGAAIVAGYAGFLWREWNRKEAPKKPRARTE
jgi:hypothetical protein